MALEPEVVALAVGLYSEDRPTNEASGELALLLGSREELLAYLFARTTFLEFHPDIREALRELVLTHGNHVATKRPAVGAPAKARDLSSQMRDEILSMANKDIADSQTAVRLDALDRQYALYSTESSPFLNTPERWFSP